MVARLHPVAAWIEPQDCLASSIRAIAAVLWQPQSATKHATPHHKMKSSHVPTPAILQRYETKSLRKEAYDATDADREGQDDQLFGFLEKLDCLLWNAHGEGFPLWQKARPQRRAFSFVRRIS
jgi:hypothetical protein